MTLYIIDAIVNIPLIRAMIFIVTLNLITFFVKKLRDDFDSHTYRMRF